MMSKHGLVSSKQALALAEIGTDISKVPSLVLA